LPNPDRRGWRVYRNGEFGFRLDLPPSWNAVRAEDGWGIDSVGSPPTAWVTFVAPAPGEANALDTRVLSLRIDSCRSYLRLLAANYWIGGNLSSLPRVGTGRGYVVTVSYHGIFPYEPATGDVDTVTASFRADSPVRTP
jgi:hypothetical protein